MRTSLFALLALSGLASAQTTWFVDASGTAPGSGTALDPYTSIDFAVNQASTLPGDTVLVLPGTYAEHVVIPGKGVALVSTDGPGSTVIDGGGSGTPLTVLGTDGTKLLVDGFTLRNGTAEPSGSYNLRGGGMFADQALFDLTRCVLEDNAAQQGGGAFFDDCVANLRRVVFRNNTTDNAGQPDGGGLYVEGGSVDILGSTFTGNVAGVNPNLPGMGGGLFAGFGSTVTVQRTLYLDNLAERAGGGARGGTHTLCRFEDNRGQFGGGLESGQAIDCRFTGNLAFSTSGTADDGGAAADSILTQCSIVGNQALGKGAGAYRSTLTDCDVRRNNSLGGDDGWFRGALLECTADGTTIAYNLLSQPFEGDVQGAGAADSTLVDCDLFGNVLVASPFQGFDQGGAGAAGSDLTDCRIFDNVSNVHGGGALESDLLRCEVWGNSADNGGGGVYDGTLERCTVYGNTTLMPFGGAAYVVNQLDVVDSILYGNGSNPVYLDTGYGPTVVDVTYSDVEGGYAGIGNIDADPLFWDAAAGDFHLQAGSPCIDAGDPNSAPDPDGSRADMGALPFDPNYTGG